MQTNDIVNAVRITDNGYSVMYTGPCMRQDVHAYELKKYGEEHADRAAVYVPDITADIKKGDYIIFGELPQELSVENALTAQSVAVNDYGSEDMQHIRIGVI